MRSIDGVDEFEIVVVCIPFVYCGETQPINKSCEMVVVWFKLCGIRMVDITTSTTPHIVSKSLERCCDEKKKLDLFREIGFKF